MKKRLNLFFLCGIILFGACSCDSSNNAKADDIKYRKAYCYYFKNDTSLSSGNYYIDIETKTNGSITTHYFTEYFTEYAKTDFAKQILEGHCLFDAYGDDENDKDVYNRTCEYENNYYVVKYDVDEEKTFDLAIHELEINEYTCIEIKDQENDDLIKGTWKNVLVIDDFEYTYIYKFYDNGIFEETQIRKYNGEPNKWINSYRESTNQGYYTFDGTNIYTIISYGSSGSTMNYDKENDTIDNKYVRVND